MIRNNTLPNHKASKDLFRVESEKLASSFLSLNLLTQKIPSWNPMSGYICKCNMLRLLLEHHGMKITMSLLFMYAMHV